MVDDATDALYTLNTATGRANRVGNANQFGLSITTPSGLAWDGPAEDDYELVLLTPTTMYKLNKTTGVAKAFKDSEIGSPATLTNRPFGTGITDASGLAAHSKRLFMVDDTTDRLYVIDRFTGLASRIGGKLISTTTPSALESVGTTLYMASTSPSGLYTLSRSIGRASLFRSVSIVGMGGLAWNGTTMYAVDDSTDALYTLPSVVAPSEPAPSADRDTQSYLPDEGDLYYNGDVRFVGVHPSYTFIDSTMRWTNPSWWSTRTSASRALCLSNPINCANYEHDLKLDRNWVKGSCVAWSNLPQSYNDCPVSGIGDPDGKIIVSFGTFKAPDIKSGEIYYGSWKFTYSSYLFSRSPRTTDAELFGQVGNYNGSFYVLGIDVLAPICPRKTILCVNPLRQDRLTSDGSEIAPFRWTRGSPFYRTYER